MSEAGMLPHDTSCVFCKIVAGKIPCHKIYEDDMVLAFLDIGPIVAGHALVIPKAHYQTVMDTPPEVLAAVNSRMPLLTRAVLEATGRQACHVLVNSGVEASQSVQHLHYHILPRYAGDGYRLPWPAGNLDPVEAAALREKIQVALARRPGQANGPV